MLSGDQRCYLSCAPEPILMTKLVISLPDKFLKKVGRTAKTQGRSRSELIREALRAALTGEAPARPSWRHVLAPLQELERQWVGRWNSTDIIRYYRETPLRPQRSSLTSRSSSSGSYRRRSPSIDGNTSVAGRFRRIPLGAMRIGRGQGPQAFDLPLELPAKLKGV